MEADAIVNGVSGRVGLARFPGSSFFLGLSERWAVSRRSDALRFLVIGGVLTSKEPSLAVMTRPGYQMQGVEEEEEGPKNTRAGLVQADKKVNGVSGCWMYWGLHR